MFEPFSSGYYLGRLYVELHDGKRAVMGRDAHQQVNERLYVEEGDGIYRTDYPLVMKVGSTHVPVHGAEGIPERTLAVPETTLESAGIDNPPTLSEVLLAKADRATQLLGV